MKKFIPILFILTSCSAMFRGTLVDIEEFSFGLKSPHQGEKIIKEIIVADEVK